MIVAGMGGSAIAGNLAVDLAGQSLGAPIRVVRDFSIPRLLGRQGSRLSQLVVACSFSGETQETLSMFDQAQAAGGQPRQGSQL